jgi:hypothetical protein
MLMLYFQPIQPLLHINNHRWLLEQEGKVMRLQEGFATANEFFYAPTTQQTHVEKRQLQGHLIQTTSTRRRWQIVQIDARFTLIYFA